MALDDLAAADRLRRLVAQEAGDLVRVGDRRW
jgi:hypothetical protein